jgi:hypothetical protein
LQTTRRDHSVVASKGSICLTKLQVNEYFIVIGATATLPSYNQNRTESCPPVLISGSDSLEAIDHNVSYTTEERVTELLCKVVVRCDKAVQKRFPLVTSYGIRIGVNFNIEERLKYIQFVGTLDDLQLL